MSRYLLLIAVVAFVLANAANDLEDHLSFNFGSGITSGLDKDSYWYPDWTRKYDDRGYRHTYFGYRTGWWPIDEFLVIPAWAFDGWHLAKIIRQWMYGTVIFFFAYWIATIMYSQGRYSEERAFDLKWMVLMAYYMVFMVIYGIGIKLFHTIFFEILYKF